MEKQQIGKFTRTDICKIFGLAAYQFEKIIKDAGDKLPRGENVLYAFKVYTDETVDFIGATYELPILVDPEKL